MLTEIPNAGIPLARKAAVIVCCSYDRGTKNKIIDATANKMLLLSYNSSAVLALFYFPSMSFWATTVVEILKCSPKTLENKLPLFSDRHNYA